MARAMALDYLLDDKTFRESWEVHNWGFMGKPRLTSSVIPSMFIIDNLGAAGVDVAELVEDQFRRLQASGQHYYNESNGLFPDGDLLNGNARLLKYSATPVAHAALMEPLYVWMERNVRPTGEIPVFFSKGVARDSGRLYCQGISRCSCTTIVANTVNVLAEVDPQRFRAVIDNAVEWLCDTFSAWGGSSNRFYTHAYFVWVAGDCLDRYIIDPDSRVAVRAKAGVARDFVRNIGHRLARQGRPAPQNAAFRLLADRDGLDDDARRRLVDVILSEQHSDGGWAAEPFYFMPSRGNGARAHESRLITSSFCHRALESAARAGQVT